MSATRKGSDVALGLRAQKGGAVVVAVALDDGEPRIALSSFLATAAAGDRLALEPYHVAYEMERGPDGGASAQAEAAVAEGRARQEAFAARGLEEIVGTLTEQTGAPSLAALLVNRAGWMTDLLAYSLAYADHPPVAEGLAVREALRSALARRSLEVAETDEKSLLDLASQLLDLSPAALDARLKSLGSAVGRPWRKEQKLACLAAWVTLAGR